VVSRVSLDHLRSARVRRETYVDHLQCVLDAAARQLELVLGPRPGDAAFAACTELEQNRPVCRGL